MAVNLVGSGECLNQKEENENKGLNVRENAVTDWTRKRWKSKISL